MAILESFNSYEENWTLLINNTHHPLWQSLYGWILTRWTPLLEGNMTYFRQTPVNSPLIVQWIMVMQYLLTNNGTLANFDIIHHTWEIHHTSQKLTILALTTSEKFTTLLKNSRDQKPTTLKSKFWAGWQ